MTAATKTIDHETIRRWVEARDGHPATVVATPEGDRAGDEAEGLRIDLEGTQPERLKRISWEQFFDTFEQSKLAFLHQDLTDSGQTGRFFKLVRRD